jgi:hypothetical protein
LADTTNKPMMRSTVDLTASLYIAIDKHTRSLCYKSFTIVKVMIVNYASVWSVTYDRNL